MKYEVRIMLASGKSMFRKVVSLAEAIADVVRLKREGFNAFYVAAGSSPKFSEIPATSYL